MNSTKNVIIKKNKPIIKKDLTIRGLLKVIETNN